jgi:ATP-NAD kinase N-terminal domain
MARTEHSVGKRGLSPPRIACVDSGSDCAKAGCRELAARYDFVPPEESDVIVALGGDGLVLRVVHEYLHLGRPIFGMNRGTVGFLLNAYRPNVLIERIQAAKEVILHPLRMTAKLLMERLKSRLPSTKYPSSAIHGRQRTFGFPSTGSLGSLCLPRTVLWWQRPPAVQLTAFQRMDRSFRSEPMCSLLLLSAHSGRDVGGELCCHAHRSLNLKTSTHTNGR